MSNFLPVCRIITIIELKVTAFNAEVDRFYDYAQAGKVGSLILTQLRPIKMVDNIY